MSLHPLTPRTSLPSPTTLADRRAAIADAFRAARSLPRRPPVSTLTPPSPVPTSPAQPALDMLRGEVRRLAERVERVENKVDLIRDGDEAPLAWPVPVATDNRLEVPPIDVKRSSSPAFDVLLGPARRDSA